jgi:hypothetical protein
MIVERSSYRSGNLTGPTQMQCVPELGLSATLGEGPEVELVLF